MLPSVSIPFDENARYPSHDLMPELETKWPEGRHGHPRHSVISQFSSTTTSNSSGSQRHSTGSTLDGGERYRWSAETDPEHVAYSPSSPTTIGSSFSSLSPSSRRLLSGTPNSESFRQQELNRFLPSFSLRSPLFRRSQTFSDPLVMPSIALAPQPCPDPPSVDRDPWCMSVKMALDQAVYQAWMHKYDIPSFAFARSWKRRYFILVDRTVYVFKSSKSTTPVREFFELTDDTLVFVSEEFKKAYVLELRKPLQRWYLRCDSVEQMKNWLEAMKKIVACIKLGFQGSISSSMLSSIRLTDDFRLVEDIPPRPSIDTTYSYRHSTTLPINLNSNSQNVRNRRWQQREMNDRRCSTPPDFALNNSNHKIPKSGFKRQSLLHIPNWATVLPPQLPPPRSLPPPIPSPTTATATATTTTTTALPTISETRQDHGS